MKIQKLLARTLFGCLLVGASGAAMAVPPIRDSSCPRGVVINEVVRNLTVDGDCLVAGTIVTGNITVNNAGTSAVFALRDTTVNGSVSVTGGSVIIRRTEVINSNLVVEDTISTAVHDTMVQAVSMRFEGNTRVLISSNVVNAGNIQCLNNQAELSVGNLIFDGVETCLGQ